MTEQIPWDEFGALMKDAKRARRAHRLERTARELTAPDVEVLEKFAPEHWRIKVAGRTFDFWPSTGRWRQFPDHKGETGRGGIPAMRRVKP